MIQAINTNKKYLLPDFFTEDELDIIKISIQKVQASGIAQSINFSRESPLKTHFKVDLSPEFDSSGKVSQVLISSKEITKKSFEATNILEKDKTISALQNLHAIATYDTELNLKDFFTAGSIHYREIFSNPKAFTILNDWIKNLNGNKASNDLLISKKDTGHVSLNISLVGINKNSDTICVSMETAKEYSYPNELLKFNALEKTIYDNVPADIAFWDLSHRYIFLNKTACPNEQTRAWLIGKNDFEYCNYRKKPIEIAIKRRVAFNKMILSGKQVSFQEELQTSSGREYHLKIFQPMLNSNGQVQFVMGYGLNTTSIKQTESKLINMSFAVRDAMDGIALLDAKGNYTYLNQAHVNMFGYKDEKELIGKSWHVLYEKEEIARIETKIFPRIEKNGRWAGRTTGRSKTGEFIYQEITLSSLPNGGLICICRDKTQERIQEHKIERAAIVADNTSSVIMITDPQIRIQWVNKAFSRLTGYTFEEVIGKDPSFLHGPETNKKEIKKLWGRLKGKKGFTAEILNYTKNGKKYWMQINATPIFNEENELDSWVYVENDITQLKQEQEIITNNFLREKELNEMKSQFVSIASHEIRNPLASIQSSSELMKMYLKKEVISKDKIENHLAKIENQISRLSTIMSNLLVVGKINVDKFDIHKNETDLEHFINELIDEFFAVTSDERKIVFRVIGTKKKSEIDKVLMSQVMINLISNAIKYSQGKPDPEVILSYEPHHFTIQVRDYGIGIPPNEQKYIYDSFFRANNAENIPGTGLGLVIVKKFVELHQGKISFSSTLNQGTCFELNFPYR